MTKTVVFSACSVAAVVVVVCWITGVLPGQSATRSQPVRVVGKAGAQTPPAASEQGLSVYFSPNGGCTETILREIGNAKDSVFVQAAQFTAAPIAKALVAAKARGVDVRVIVDRKKDDEDSQGGRLLDGDVSTFVDGRHHTAHNKVIIVDHRLVLTGSFNFTRESEAENAENLLVIEGKPKLVAAYESNFKEHLAHSAPYEK